MRIEGDYSIIETLEEAAVLGTEPIEGVLISGQELVSAPYILEAITPKEGDAVFIVREQMGDSRSPEYFIDWSPTFTGPGELVVPCNAITKNNNCGRIRELLTWATS